MRLVIDNRTAWKTAHLRPFIMRALRHERASLFKRQPYPAAFRCIVKYNRQVNRGFCSGHAPLGGNWMTVMLPSGHADKVDFGLICFHEAAHTRGARHPEMRGESLYHRVGNWRELFSWAEALPLEKELPQRKARPSIEAKLVHANAMLLRARTREKRAITIRKRWEKKIRRFTISSIASASESPSACAQSFS